MTTLGIGRISNGAPFLCVVCGSSGMSVNRNRKFCDRWACQAEKRRRDLLRPRKRRGVVTVHPVGTRVKW